MSRIRDLRKHSDSKISNASRNVHPPVDPQNQNVVADTWTEGYFPGMRHPCPQRPDTTSTDPGAEIGSTLSPWHERLLRPKTSSQKRQGPIARAKGAPWQSPTNSRAQSLPSNTGSSVVQRWRALKVEIQRLWDELQVVPEECAVFAASHFSQPSQQKCLILQRELERLKHLSQLTTKVFFCISQREQAFDAVSQLARSSSMADPVQLNLLINQLRLRTLECIEALYYWRLLNGPGPEVLWNGAPYHWKIKEDACSLAVSPLAAQLPFVLIGNDVLDPTFGAPEATLATDNAPDKLLHRMKFGAAFLRTLCGEQPVSPELKVHGVLFLPKQSNFDAPCSDASKRLVSADCMACHDKPSVTSPDNQRDLMDNTSMDCGSTAIVSKLLAFEAPSTLSGAKSCLQIASQVDEEGNPIPPLHGQPDDAATDSTVTQIELLGADEFAESLQTSQGQGLAIAETSPATELHTAAINEAMKSLPQRVQQYKEKLALRAVQGRPMVQAPFRKCQGLSAGASKNWRLRCFSAWLSLSRRARVQMFRKKAKLQRCGHHTATRFIQTKCASHYGRRMQQLRHRRKDQNHAFPMLPPMLCQSSECDFFNALSQQPSEAALHDPARAVVIIQCAVRQWLARRRVAERKQQSLFEEAEEWEAIAALAQDGAARLLQAWWRKRHHI